MTSEKKPNLYLFFGDDGFGMSQTVKEMLSHFDDPLTGELNTTRLSGNIRVEQIKDAAFALPFLAERRTVIVYDTINLVRSAKNEEAFLKLLESLPPSTALILLVETERDKKDWKEFKPSHWLRKWVSHAPDGFVYEREYALPHPAQMRQWVMEETRRQKGEIVPQAAAELANLLGANTQLASQEINKLLTYVNFARVIEIDDVKELVSDVAPANIFDMVDALADGRQQAALRLLHELLDEKEAELVFGMIVRQFRLLLQTRELIDLGYPKEKISTELRLHPFVAEKLEKQARRFSLSQLEKLYPQLLEMDESSKSSRHMDLPLAMDLLLSELSLT